MKNPLFNAVLRESGLAPIIAGPALKRAFISVGIDPEDLTVQDLRRALPAIESCLRVFLPHERMRECLHAISQLE